MKTAAKIAKNLFSAAASLGFSLMLAVYIILFALFMGAYELPVKLLLIGAIPLTLILFYVRLFEKKAGLYSLLILIVIVAGSYFVYHSALDSIMEGPLYQAPDVDREMFAGKKVLILSPHQDDEMNMLAGTVGEYTRLGSEVYLVYSTNGDALVSADCRWTEVHNAMEPQGIAPENIIFLGYGDGWQGEHLYDAEEDEPKTSAAGFTETYSTGVFETYRVGRAYTKRNFLDDLKAVILEIRPDIIFCVDYDEHQDHRALSMAFEDVMGEILREEDYSPCVMKAFAYSTAWEAARDYHKSRNLGATVNKYPTDYMQENNIYLWQDRIRLPVQGSLLSRGVWNTPLYEYLSAFSTQKVVENSIGIINSDKVAWQRNCEGISYKSSLSASSGKVWLLNDFALADSSTVNGDIDYSFGTWIPAPGDDERSVRMEFPEETTVKYVYLYDNPDMEHNILQLELSFDDGSSIVCGPLAPNGSVTRIETDTGAVKSMELTVTQWEGDEAGLTEIEVYPQEQSAPFPLIKLCSSDGNFIYDYHTADKNSILRLYTLGIEDAIGPESYTLSVDNPQCSAEFVPEGISVSCPRGESCFLTITHRESGEYDSIRLYCMKSGEKLRSSFDYAVFEKYQNSLDEQMRRFGWVENFSGLGSLVLLAFNNMTKA